MKITYFFKTAHGTIFATNKPLPLWALHNNVVIDNVSYIVVSVPIEDNQTFMINEKISEVKNKEIKFIK